MNLPTLIVLLLLAVALFFALRAYLRAGRAGSCSCGSAGSSDCGSSSCSGSSRCSSCSSTGCPFCRG